MLESFFKYRGVLERMRRGPLADEIDSIADDLAHTGYLECPHSSDHRL